MNFFMLKIIYYYERKFKPLLSTIPPIYTKQTTIFHLKILLCIFVCQSIQKRSKINKQNSNQ
jgi:hypothetical protein